MKKLVFAFAALTGLVASAAVMVTVNRAQQRFPWNGLVDVDIELADVAEGTGYRPEIALVSGNIEYAASTFVTDPVLTGNGAHRLTWDFAADFPGTVLSNVTVRVGVAPIAETDPLYLVFDISAGPTAESYPHWYTTEPPDLSKDACRTTELWFRRIPAGQFTMGYSGTSAYSPLANRLPPHQVKITKPYYIGVFEMTQGQYFRLTGEWPSFFTHEASRETRPVEMVSVSMIRGSSGWYDNPPTVASTSKVYVWRPKFGFPTLDLPTEAQWEMAARGTTTGPNYAPGITEKTLGRNKDEISTAGVVAETPAGEGGTAKVGSYRANPWGLYDIMGNVNELVGDGNVYNKINPDDADYSAYTVENPRIDPRGPTAEAATRLNLSVDYLGGGVYRGGAWNVSATSMRSYIRSVVARSDSGRANDAGFRLCITCE